MGFLILIGIVLVIAGIVKALDHSTQTYPRRRARAVSTPRRLVVPPISDATGWHSGGNTYFHNDWPSAALSNDDHTRNTGSATSWDASGSHCAPSDSSSYDSGSYDSGGCDSGGGSDSDGGGGCDGGSFD